MNLSSIEQSPRLRNIYTQLCFCYPVVDRTSRKTVIDTLNGGLERLTASFPWLSGQVVSEGAQESGRGKFKVIPFEAVPRLLVRDLTHDDSAPTMDALNEANFPFSMLDENAVCPRMTFAGGPGETSSDPAPVLLLQVNLISRGLLLSIVAIHSTMDIVGQGQIVRLLSKACRGEPFTTEEVRNGNLDRCNLIPVLDNSLQPESKVDCRISEQVSTPSTPLHASVTAPPAHIVWAYFSFRAAQLAALKSFAMSTIPGSSMFVSTDDSLCAILWQSIARARLARLDPTTDSTFTRAIDVRRIFGIPDTFPGNMTTKTTSTSTLQRLADEPLGAFALQLRSKLDPSALKHQTQLEATATSQARAQDISTGSATDRTKTVVMSSWSKVDCCRVDFGLGLGPPAAVRRPRFEPMEGVIYLLPKTPDGEIVAGLCLRHDDMAKLKADNELTKYAQYIG